MRDVDTEPFSSCDLLPFVDEDCLDDDDEEDLALSRDDDDDEDFAFDED